jgi:chromosome segregation ATPase
MALKFFRVSAANAEIARLEVEVASLTKERDELKTAVEANASETATAAEDLQAQLSASARCITDLTADRDGIKAELAKAQADLTAANEKLANPSAEVVKIASAKAAEITAAQGQPPISGTPAGTPAGGAGGIVEQWQSIQNPREKTAFYRANEKAILAAWKPARS